MNEVCPDLNALQRAAGFVTWQNLLQAAGIALAACGTLFFTSGLLRHVLRHLRVVEALLWALGLGAVAAGAFVPLEHRVWPVLFGCLVAPGALALTMFLRKLRFEPRRVFGGFALFWGLAAAGYQLPVVGFLAVAAALAWLGLFIAVGPGWYAFGFRDREAIPRGTAAGALMTIVFGLLAAAQATAGPLDVFRPGALWLGTFAWFLGVLIVGSRFFRGPHYAARQALALVSLLGSLAFGLLYGMAEIKTMAAAFLLFFLLGKIIEVPVRGRIAFGLKLLVAGGLLSVLWYASGEAGQLLALGG